MIERTTAYFENTGKDNTENVIKAVKRRCEVGDIQAVVVASTTGKTALDFHEAIPGMKVACVTYHAGFHGGDTIDIDENIAAQLESGGVPIVRSIHALSGVSRSFSKKFGGITPVEIVANTLRFMGQGVKVAVEISIMAADAGAITTDNDIIAVGGSGKGADAALVLRAAHMNNFLDLKIREVIAKPLLS